jgi:hypothetical protein
MCRACKQQGPKLRLLCNHHLLLSGCHCDRHDVHLQIIYFGREVRQPEAG